MINLSKGISFFSFNILIILFIFVDEENYKTTNNYDAQYDSSLEFDEQLDEQSEKNETINHPNSSMSDWDDETYSSW